MAPDRHPFEDELDKGRFALIGAGRLAEMTLQMWPQDIPRPAFILDSFKTGELLGVPIKPMASHKPEPGLCYLLAIFETSAKTILEIYQDFPALPLVTVYDFFDRHLAKEFSNGWSHLDAGPDTRAKIELACGTFSTANAQQVYLSAAAWRYDRDLRPDYPTIPGPERFNLQAFGRDNSHYDLVVDGGAYDLDLMKALEVSKVTCDRYIAFEPDPDNAALAGREAEQYGDLVAVEELALSDKPGTEPFIANGLMSARLEPDGKAAIQATSLDAYLVDAFTSDGGPRKILCKLHLESAEPRALKGAEQMIAENQVDWFVNLSHDETSFLTIPVWLDQFDCYDLFLRSYSLFGEGLTLFARHRGRTA